MSASRHHVVVGSGVAGSQAAQTLRSRDPDSRVTMITLSSLPFYNRYDLPRVFRGERDWRHFLVHPPQFYTERRIALRRACQVALVDTRARTIVLGHKEAVPFDRLLVASGGRGYLPAELSDYRPLMHGFGSFEQAMTTAAALPEGGRVLMLGGDMIGLDLARTLIDTGYRVTLVTGDQTFWPHEVDAAERARLLDSIKAVGIDVLDCAACGGIAAISQGAAGLAARCVTFRDGSELHGDVVMPFYGLVPAVEFMLGSGVDIERGLLVDKALRTTDDGIYAAGDVCQIWSDEERRYRFYYGWKNVRAMGELAARNMTGADEEFLSAQDERLHIAADGGIQSPFWDYE
jgi:NAD(P)H-nitrite reductase large subunit